MDLAEVIALDFLAQESSGLADVGGVGSHAGAHEVVLEPLGGAHHDPQKTAENIKESINKNLKSLKALDKDELLKLRYKKYRDMGRVE